MIVWIDWPLVVKKSTRCSTCTVHVMPTAAPSTAKNMTATRRRMYNSINFIGGVYIPVPLKESVPIETMLVIKI